MKIELFFKSSLQLASTLNLISQRPKLQSHLHFNLPNKVRDENLFPFAEQILQTIPSSSSICLHYSLKNQRAKGLSDATDKFIHFLSTASSLGIREVLLVSGSGEKRAINSLTCLQNLKSREYQLPSQLQVSVAFNPYYSDLGEYGLEKQRLLEKIRTGYVSLIYLQFGSNIEMLQQSLEWIQTLKDSNSIPSSLKVYGSIFLPSKQLLARMKFRPWKGLLLTDEFLSNVATAETIVIQMLEIYRRYSVEVIIETAFRTDKEAEYLENLLNL